MPLPLDLRSDPDFQKMEKILENIMLHHHGFPPDLIAEQFHAADQTAEFLLHPSAVESIGTAVSRIRLAESLRNHGNHFQGLIRGGK